MPQNRCRSFRTGLAGSFGQGYFESRKRIAFTQRHAVAVVNGYMDIVGRGSRFVYPLAAAGRHLKYVHMYAKTQPVLARRHA
jgi:hypothetical protein